MKTVSLNEILFDVKNVDTHETFGYPANSDYSNAIIGNIDGEEKILNVCSDRYNLVPNAEIFLPIRQMLLDSGIDFTETYLMANDNARFYASYRINDAAVKVGQSNDLIYPELRVAHSYNGLQDYNLSFGYYRLICSNGLVIPVAEKEQFNINSKGKHTKKMDSELDQLKEKIEYFICNSDLAIKGYTQLFDNWVADPRERVKEVLSVAKLADFSEPKPNAKGKVNLKGFNLANERLNSIMNTISIERDELKGDYTENVNDWLIYNAINKQFNQVETNKKTPTQLQAIDNKVLDVMFAS